VVSEIFYGPILHAVRLMGKGDLTNGDCMLPVKTDKDIIRYLREALRIQEHNTHSMADKYCKIYKMYKAYRISKRK